MSNAPLVRIENISKSFGQVQALTGVDASVNENEILAVVGDNGAGKSTLIKILTGNLSPDEGEIRMNGSQVQFSTPRQARDHGIGVVYQDLALVDSLTVAENVFLGNYPRKTIAGRPLFVDWEQMRQRASDTIKSKLGLDLDPTSRVELLSGGERQVVAIARALISDPDVVVLDEPTAKLSEATIDQVQELIRQLQSTGHTIVLIEHNVEQVLEIADRILVLYNGQRVDIVETDEVIKDDILRMMISGDAEAPEQLA
jgi:ABC-type sugar transport system ATPase subunit